MAAFRIEEALTVLLANDLGLSALVAGRVYQGRIPQGATLPCLTYNRISTPRVHTMDSSGAGGTAYPRFQIDAWGSQYSTVKTVTDAVRAALNGFHGAISSGGYTVTVQSALVEDERYLPDPDLGLERIASDYIVWHVEA